MLLAFSAQSLPIQHYQSLTNDDDLLNTMMNSSVILGEKPNEKYNISKIY